MSDLLWVLQCWPTITDMSQLQSSTCDISQITSGIGNLRPWSSVSAGTARDQLKPTEALPTDIESGITPCMPATSYSSHVTQESYIPFMLQANNEHITATGTCPAPPPGSPTLEGALTDGSSAHSECPTSCPTPPQPSSRRSLNAFNTSFLQDHLGEYALWLEGARLERPSTRRENRFQRERRGATSLASGSCRPKMKSSLASGVKKSRGKGRSKVSFVDQKQERDDEAVCDDSDDEISYD